MTFIKLTTDCSRMLRRASRNRASTNSACRLLNDWDTERMLCKVLTSWSRAVMETVDHSCDTTADITSLSFSSTVVTSIWRCLQETTSGIHTRCTQNTKSELSKLNRCLSWFCVEAWSGWTKFQTNGSSGAEKVIENNWALNPRTRNYRVYPAQTGWLTYTDCQVIVLQVCRTLLYSVFIRWYKTFLVLTN